jgi:Mg-chelatase subunit ChlD
MALLRLNGEGRLCLRSAGMEEVAETPVLKDVLLLIDTSGSMAGEKITQAKHGAADFSRTASLQGRATALAVFGDRAEVVCDPTIEAVAFQKKIGALAVGMVGGSTNLDAGLKLAAKFANLGAVVVVTDGQPDSPDAALLSAARLKQNCIEILCIGTDDADGSFLAKLATRKDLSSHVDARNLRASIAQASQLLLGK